MSALTHCIKSSADYNRSFLFQKTANICLFVLSVLINKLLTNSMACSHEGYLYYQIISKLLTSVEAETSMMIHWSLRTRFTQIGLLKKHSIITNIGKVPAPFSKILSRREPIFRFVKIIAMLIFEAFGELQ